MNKVSKLLVIINPKSGGTDKAELKKMIKKEAEAQKLDFEIFETTGENDKEKLQSIINNNKPLRVIVAGGDGTVNMVSSLLVSTPSVMGIIPVGSANGLAKELNIPQNEKEALSIALGEKTLKIDAIKLEEQGLSLHLSDIGLNAKMIKNYSQSNEHGFFAYIKEFFRSFNKQQLIDLKLTDGKKEWRRTAYMAVIANARMYGTGIRINPEGRVNDGKFEVVLLCPLNWRYLLRRMIGKKDRQIMEIIHTDYIKISTPTEISFQIDGEYIGPIHEVKASIVPSCIEVAIGNDYPVMD